MKKILILAISLLLLTAFTLNAREHIVKPSPVRPINQFSGANWDSLGESEGVTAPFSDNFDYYPDQGNVNNWDLTNGGFWHFLTNPQQIRVADDIRNNMVELPDDGYLPYAYSGTTVLWYGEDSTGTFIGSDYNQNQSYDYNYNDDYNDENPFTTGTYQSLFDSGYYDNSSYDNSYYDSEYKDGGTSAEPNSGYVVSPMIDLSNISNPELSFYSWWEIEGVDSNAYDMMYVEISTDGSNFEELGTLNPINDVDAESYKPYSSAGVGEPGIWKKYTFDLSDYAGQKIYIRFRFDTIDSLYNGFRGWMIDNFAVTGKSSSTTESQAPQITSVSPSSAYPGQIIEVYGKNFYYSSTVMISSGSIFNQSDESVSTVYQGDNHLTFYLPSDLSEGSTVSIYVKNPDGTQSNSESIKVTSKSYYPSLTKVSPISASDDEPLTLTLSGSNLGNIVNVSIGGVSASSVTPDSSGSQITATFSPCALSSGYKNIEVEDKDGNIVTDYGAIKITESGKCTQYTAAASVLDFRNTCIGTDDPITVRIEDIIYNNDLLGSLYVWGEFKFNISTVKLEFVSAGGMEGKDTPTSNSTSILDFTKTCVASSDDPMSIYVENIEYKDSLLGNLKVWAEFKFDLNSVSFTLTNAGAMASDE